MEFYNTNTEKTDIVTNNQIVLYCYPGLSELHKAAKAELLLQKGVKAPTLKHVVRSLARPLQMQMGPHQHTQKTQSLKPGLDYKIFQSLL